MRIPKVDVVRRGLSDEQYAKALNRDNRYKTKRVINRAMSDPVPEETPKPVIEQVPIVEKPKRGRKPQREQSMPDTKSSAVTSDTLNSVDEASEDNLFLADIFEEAVQEEKVETKPVEVNSQPVKKNVSQPIQQSQTPNMAGLSAKQQQAVLKIKQKEEKKEQRAEKKRQKKEYRKQNPIKIQWKVIVLTLVVGLLLLLTWYLVMRMFL